MSSYLVFIVLWVLQFTCFSHPVILLQLQETLRQMLWKYPTTSCFHKVHILTVIFYCHQKMQTP